MADDHQLTADDSTDQSNDEPHDAHVAHEGFSSYGQFNILDHDGVLHIANVRTTFVKVAGRRLFWTALGGLALVALVLWTPVPALFAGVVAGFSAGRLVVRLRRLWQISRIEAVSATEVRVNHQWADPHLVSGTIAAGDVAGVRRCTEGDLCCVELVLRDGRCAQLVTTVTGTSAGTRGVDRAAALIAERLGVPVDAAVTC